MKPANILTLIDNLLASHSATDAEALISAVRNALPLPEVDWPAHFIHDNELHWQRGFAPVEDL